MVHRDFAARVLNWVIVAPVTTTVRGIPTEVRLGPREGLDRECAASLDNLTGARRSQFLRYLGRLSDDRMDEVCSAVSVTLACRPRSRRA